jgi:hypothetical protein
VVVLPCVDFVGEDLLVGDAAIQTLRREHAEFGFGHVELIGRQAQQTGSRRLAPGEQVLRRDAVLARHLRHDGAGRIGFRDDSSLDFVTSATPTPRPHMDINLRRGSEV